MYLFDQIKKEYAEYVKTAEKHNDSPIDGYVIMGHCYEELPLMIADKFAEDVLYVYHDKFDGKLLIDPHTIKQIICAMALTLKD